MNLLPRSLVARLGVALLGAVAGVAMLQHVVVTSDRAAAATLPPTLPPPVVSPLLGLGFRLVPIAGVVTLVTRMSAIPPDRAPVLQVLDDGSLAVRRPPVVSGAPGSAWQEVAVVVPAAPLDAWSPMARAALADVLGGCLGARPAPRDRVRIVDAELSSADVVSLLSWLP